MSYDKDGGPAFPSDEKSVNGSHAFSHLGMTLRDWFAGQALMGLAAAMQKDRFRLIYDGIHGDGNIEATVAYALAEAMLAKRSSSK